MKAVGGKFLLRRLENAKPHALGIALPLQNSLCLGQIGRSMIVEPERDDFVIPLYLLFEHDLFGKPVPTFPDHARQDVARAARFEKLRT
jgi:hypothetical protein